MFVVVCSKTFQDQDQTRVENVGACVKGRGKRHHRDQDQTTKVHKTLAPSQYLTEAPVQVGE